MDEPSRYALAVKARQIGYSHATAASCVKGGLYQRRTQVVLSASQVLSDEVLAKVRSHCRVLALLGEPSAVAHTVDNATEIAWRSGGRVIALPANPRTARSFSGDVHQDESAYYSDPEGIRDAVFPIVSREDYRLRICSTPNGAAGLFYSLATNPPPGWSIHRVTVDDAAADGFPVDRDKLWSLCGGDERLFAQWFLCSFADADEQYYPTALVDRALAWTGTPFDPAEPGDSEHVYITAGLDVGRHADLSALTVLALHRGVAHVLGIHTMKRTEFTTQWPGEAVAITFSNATKADMATRLLRWFRDEKLRLPKTADGRALRDDCIALRRVITESGNVVYTSPRTTAGGHGDRLWSLALGAIGLGEPQQVLAYGRQPLMLVS